MPLLRRRLECPGAHIPHLADSVVGRNTQLDHQTGGDGDGAAEPPLQ